MCRGSLGRIQRSQLPIPRRTLRQLYVHLPNYYIWFELVEGELYVFKWPTKVEDICAAIERREKAEAAELVTVQNVLEIPLVE
jgi:hypothetical protein